MSYARFSFESDVYVYADGYRINCCGCRLLVGTGEYQVSFETPKEMLRHLNQHLLLGHEVPDYAIERLGVEMRAGWRPSSAEPSPWWDYARRAATNKR